MTQSIQTFAAQAGQTALREAPRIAAAYAADQATLAATNILFGPVKRTRAGRPLEEIRILTAGEGGGIPRVYGRARVGGQIIWASDVSETTFTQTSTTGAKGVKRASETSATEYRYKVSVAIALCDGELIRIGRVWADGNLITLADFDYRIYHGTEDQSPDPLIEALDGTAPAYKGTAYIVIEELDLAPFGNRIPQFNFEIVCPVGESDPDDMEQAIRAVTLIPGSGEAVYAMEPVFETTGEGVTTALNRHNGLGLPDAEASLDELQAVLPNLESVSLVVSWFGDDLRAGHCQVRPGTERPERVSEPDLWSVNGETRAEVRPLTQNGETPSYGGTPSDESVKAIIQDIKARGLAVTFHPFVLMDIPADNALNDPSGAPSQPPYPWRGRIRADSEVDDSSAAVRAQVDQFFDSYEVMALHYAELCAEAGGVETFLIGSELRGLTRLRDESGAFPAVQRLIQLAQAVKAILPAATITYGADWSEYGSYVPSDALSDLYYPLDPLWADSSIGAIGIDNYFPLTDWREGEGHLDAAEAEGPYDLDYIASRVAGGEGFDWYYASEADRQEQVRTPITDGAFGEPHVFRPKDLISWWSLPHEERSAGSKTGATPWVPQSKPILFTEIGCAAIDKGANQPNVFLDPKSSESFAPHFSTGARDDRAQRAALEAQHRYWSKPQNNPASSVYGGSMLDASRMAVYCWDARPFPEFPARQSLWADAGNWTTGHWLNGRAGKVRLSRLIEALGREAGLFAINASACDQLLSGYVVSEPMTARQAIEPLLDLYQLDTWAREGVVYVAPRHGTEELSVDEGDLVLRGDRQPLALDHRQAEELPAALSLTYADELSGFGLKIVEARDETDPGGRTARIGTSVIMEEGEARARARAILAEARGMDLTASFALPELADGIEPGTVLRLTGEEGALTLRVTAMTETDIRAIDTVRTDPGLFAVTYEGIAASPDLLPVTYGAVLLGALDIPLLTEGSTEAQLWLAAFAEPWPGGVAVYRQGEAALLARLSRQSPMGRLTAPLAPGTAGRWDRGSTLSLSLPAGSLESRPEADILAGAQLAAVETPRGWELLQFQSAALQPDGTWQLSGFLRGRNGTEEEAAAGADTGSRIVLLDEASSLPLPPDRWGITEAITYGPEGAEPGAYPYREGSIALEGRGARPLSPVHLRAENAAGTTTLHWIRRTRIGGDRFSSGDIPLGETEEHYEINVFDQNGALLETIETTAPTASFAQANAHSVTVAQRSSVYGAGRAASLVL
ncbi:hypothetical protein HK107_11670 [Parvularcula sp. ZS-1/3]|uniref:Host specificity protein n=1 Tax=Parvularcula mediterranea TaxID=2732508 RepID=A0A7Y3RMT7_9PROT|nr:glycoside hydrolase/phage tail family protein [Parvularcula mediterranea]NNU16978.1 hypothetical protein [Parvularcula mediterranea]